MVEKLGRIVIYMGGEAIRVYTNVRPVFGVRRDTQTENSDLLPEQKSFSELLEEEIEKEQK